MYLFKMNIINDFNVLFMVGAFKSLNMSMLRKKCLPPAIGGLDKKD